MSSNWSSEIGRIAGIVAMAFFALLTAAQAWRYFRTALGLSVVPRRWLRRKDAKRGKDGQARRRDEVRETDSECGADARTRRDALSGADLRREVSADLECETNARVRRDVPRDATSMRGAGALCDADLKREADALYGVASAHSADAQSHLRNALSGANFEPREQCGAPDASRMRERSKASQCPWPAGASCMIDSRAERLSAVRILWMVMALFGMSRLLMLAATSIYAAANGSFAYYWEHLWEHWRRWDARHYLDLMEQWYVTEGDLRLSLVFFPLYPLLGRALVLLGVPARAAGMLISNAALIGCGWVLTALVQETYGAKIARRTLALFFFCPVTFFFSMPYTESVFLLTTLMAVWLARRGRFGWAVVCGALAANARMVGMTTAIPIFWEMLRRAWDDYARRNVHARRTDGAFVKRALGCVLRVLPVSVGLLLYLALNWQLYRNPLQFLIFQRENWSQQMGSLANTVHYTLANALVYDKLLYRMGVWIPQSLTLFAAIALMAATARRQHPGDAAYALVYFYMSVSPTWLLSGTRYVAAMYALYPMLALLLRGKRGFAVLFGIEIILLVWMTILGISIGYVL